MKKDLISVIVPVYNVETYLPECLDSILQQNYDELEIILVDDGSADDSGNICDAYADRDKRIVVIHQSNKGLSEARNAGIKRASGKYLMFVDSDDRLLEGVIVRLETLCRTLKAQIAVCGYLCYDKSKKKSKIDSTPRIMETDEAVRELCADKTIKNFAWGKLYESAVFHNVWFPPGQLFEDINTTYKAFLNSERVVYDETPGYYYRIRQGAITQTKTIHQSLQRIYALQSRYVDIVQRQNGLEVILLKQMLYAYVSLAKAYRQASEEERRQKRKEIDLVIGILVQHRKDAEAYAAYDRIELAEYKSLVQMKEKAFSRLIGLDYLHKITKRIFIDV